MLCIRRRYAIHTQESIVHRLRATPCHTRSDSDFRYRVSGDATPSLRQGEERCLAGCRAASPLPSTPGRRASFPESDTAAPFILAQLARLPGGYAPKHDIWRLRALHSRRANATARYRSAPHPPLSDRKRRYITRRCTLHNAHSVETFYLHLATSHPPLSEG